jgi:hypothetical protein
MIELRVVCSHLTPAGGGMCDDEEDFMRLHTPYHCMSGHSR